MNDQLEERIDTFLALFNEVEWLSHAGQPAQNAVVVPDVVTGWDDWNDQMLATWLPRSKALEELSRKLIGEEGITLVFNKVSTQLDQPIRMALQRYFDTRPNVNENTNCNADLGLWPELLDTIKRDISWAAIEQVTGNRGFFSDVVHYYLAGRWPCAWSGQYPDGQAVLL